MLVAHVVVLGYWLGAEFVINAGFRYVCYRGDMPFDERSRLMAHVMHVDQHVRYALVLQVGLGFALATTLGYVAGGSGAADAILVATLLWLIFVEVVHRLRDSEAGAILSLIDRVSRIFLLLGFLLLALIPELINAPTWLRWKLALFAGVIACGIGIRQILIGFFATWSMIRRNGVTDAANLAVRRAYVRATSILVILWLCITAIVVLSVTKL